VDPTVGTRGVGAWSAVGTGPRGRVGVLVLHGFTANTAGTRPLGEHLATEGFTVEVPLLPGHGTSPRDLARTSYRDWYGLAEQRLDALRRGCDQVALVGHSMGGTLVLDLASRRPADVAAVAVINPLILHPTQPLARLSPVLQYLVPYVPRDAAGMPTNDLARRGVDEQAYRLVPSRAARSLIVELRRIRGQLIDLQQPLLVVWSPEDHTVPAANARELFAYVGSIDTTELVCDRSYHLPQLDHDEQKVADGIATFLAEATRT
jgi:carboxylesterase